MRTGWAFHERFLWHDSGTAAGTRGPGGWIAPGRPFEQPAVAARMRGLIDASGLLAQLVPVLPRPASREELLRVHDASWLDALDRTAAAGGGMAAPNVPVGADSVEIARLTREVLDVAADVCAGRVVCGHEGGYSEYYVPFCGLAVLEELSGVRTGVEDPYFPGERRLAYDDLQDHQRRAIDAAGDKRLHSAIDPWSPPAASDRPVGDGG